MRSLAFLALLAVFFALPVAAADWRERPAAGAVVDAISRQGDDRFATSQPVNGDLTTAALKLGSCETAMVCVTPDITNNETFDLTAEVVQCPEGSTAHTGPGCKTRWFRDADGTKTKNLDGDESNGTDCVFSARGPVVFVTWASIGAGRTTQVDAYCEQAD